MEITKTQAIKAARGHVSTPIRIGNSTYVIYGPWDSSNPGGATTERQVSSYSKALVVRTQWVASIALQMMGYPANDVYFALRKSEETTVEGLVGAYLKTKDRINAHA